MKTKDIQILLSEKVLSQIEDKSIQNIVRNIIFNSDSQINWQVVKNIIAINMPELKL